jgi:hypothetical protein
MRAVWRALRSADRQWARRLVEGATLAEGEGRSAERARLLAARLREPDIETSLALDHAVRMSRYREGAVSDGDEG